MDSGAKSARIKPLLGDAFLISAMSAVKNKLDDRKRNGAMFLGLNGICVKSHGGADAYSFCNAISVAVELVAHHINERIIQEITTATQTSLESSPTKESQDA